ncbi:MAG: hypothetical protein ACFFD4_07880 [Candidatus Odinarchaeota archaeon]
MPKQERCKNCGRVAVHGCQGFCRVCFIREWRYFRYINHRIAIPLCDEVLDETITEKNAKIEKFERELEEELDRLFGKEE